MALLAALGNAANSQATLDTMATAKREIDQAISANNAALREATEAQAALSDLEARAGRGQPRSSVGCGANPTFGCECCGQGARARINLARCRA
jgi:hypothetical protein